MSKQQVSKLCTGCKNMEVFGTKCFFYWDRKKECSNFMKANTNIPIFKKVDFSE